MSEEQQNNPSFDFKDLAIGESMVMKLDGAKPAKVGESKYGEWNLWFGFVTDATVTEGRKPNTTKVPNYTGKVVFFPSEKLNENLIKAANGNTNVEVKISKKVEEGPKGLYRTYVVEKVSEGEPSASSLTPTETNLIKDAEKLIADGFEVTADVLITASKEEQYAGKITEERVRELFNKLVK